MPFKIRKKTPSRKLKKVLKESKKIAKDPNVKGYTDVDKMLKDILVLALVQTGTHGDIF